MRETGSAIAMIRVEPLSRTAGEGGRERQPAAG